MEFKNLIIADEHDKILYLGKHVMEYITSKEIIEPIGYAQNHIQVNDIYIIVINDVNKMPIEDRTSIEETGKIKIPATGGYIVIGCYQNDDIETLVKAFDNKNQRTKEPINTIYNGYKIKVVRDNNKHSIRIYANEQYIEFNEDCTIPMVLLNTKGIKYFGTDRKINSDETIADIFDGREYNYYWDKQLALLSGLSIEDVIRHDVAIALKSLDEQKIENSILINGKRVNIKRVLIPDSTYNLKIWTMMAETDVMDNIKELLHTYRTIKRKSQENQLTAGYTFGLWGEDEKINRIRYLLQKSSNTNTTILLTGESGTGKTYLAKEIHNCSKRQNKSFVHVNCAAIPYNLIESELFGYEEGAFTGAKKGGKTGYFQLAEGGTLFLDEITEMPLQLQGKLLEVIQNKTYFRVGGEKKQVADVRIIAATNKELLTLVKNHKFREDLFYRINVFPVEIPPLRERIDSLFNIVTDLLPGICNHLDIKQLVISTEALEKMKQYSWPGNIRELENVLEKAAILSDGNIIQPEDVEIEQTECNETLNTLKELKDSFEKEVIEKTLKLYNGSKIKTAEKLAIGKTSLFEKIKKYGIEENKTGGLYK